MPALTRSLVFRGTLEVKQHLEKILRQIMATDIVDEKYRYSSDEKLSKIRIYRAYPRRIEFYPSIVIIAGSHDVDVQSFDGEHEISSEVYENGVLKSQTATGYSRIPITMKVYARSGDDRDAVVGILVMLLRILSRGQFTEFGWNKIRVGEDQHTVDSTLVTYTNTVTIQANTDYNFLLTVDQDQLITKIVGEVIPVLQITP